MTYLKTISVNELVSILERHYKTNFVFIENAKMADCRRKRPLQSTIKLGGRLDITFSINKKVKGAICESE